MISWRWPSTFQIPPVWCMILEIRILGGGGLGANISFLAFGVWLPWVKLQIVCPCLSCVRPVSLSMLGSWVTGSSDFAASVKIQHFIGTQLESSTNDQGVQWHLIHTDQGKLRSLRPCSKRCGRSMQGAWRSWPRREIYKFQQWNRHEDSRNAIRKGWCLQEMRKIYRSI